MNQENKKSFDESRVPTSKALQETYGLTLTKKQLELRRQAAVAYDRDGKIIISSTVDNYLTIPYGQQTTRRLLILNVIKDDSITEAEKEKVFEGMVRGVSQKFLRQDLSQYRLVREFNLLVKMDTSLDEIGEEIEHRRVKKALLNLNENEFKQITQSLSAGLMEKLQHIDVDVCEPERMATYIKAATYRSYQARRSYQDALARGKRLSGDRGSVVNLRNWEALVTDFLDIVCEREMDGEDGFADEVIKALITEEDGTMKKGNIAKYYPIREIQSLIERGEEGACSFSDYLVSTRWCFDLED